jgi:hypothetical protein
VALFVSEMEEPTHTVEEPLIGPSSWMEALTVFHLSVPDAEPSLFTAFSAACRFTVPAPPEGAVHVADTVYVVNRPPVPVAGDSGELCSAIVTLPKVVVWLPVDADNVPIDEEVVADTAAIW